MRGGGGNFGIVTEFEFRLNPLGPMVLAGPIFWPMEESPQVLRFYRDWIAEAPDELMTIVVHRKAPAASLRARGAARQARRGRGLLLRGSRRGGRGGRAPAQGSSARRCSTLCVPKPFVAHQAMFDPSFPHGWWYYFRSCDVAELTDDVIDITVEHSMPDPARRCTAFPIWQMGGAVARVGEDDTAFNGRGRRAHLQHHAA